MTMDANTSAMPHMAPLSTHRAYTTWSGRLLAGLLIGYVYLHDLTKIPAGFFCDEAEIGLQSAQLLNAPAPHAGAGLFYSHFGSTSGTLPLYATAPFLMFGLNEFTVRLASAAYMLASFGLLYLILKQLGVIHSGAVVLFFALTPVVIHIGRINFGHSPSLFFLLLGFFLYVLSIEKKKMVLAMLGGSAFGVSAYGYPGFYLASFLFVCVLVLTEVVMSKFDRQDCKYALVVTIVAGMCFLPITYQALYNPEFFRRFDAKDQANSAFSLTKRLGNIIQNYPKYYDYAYLFSKGEVNHLDLAQGNHYEYTFEEGGVASSTIPITRHSVIGSGILLKITLPIFLIGLVVFITQKRNDDKRRFAPFFVLFVLYPLPDVITTQNAAPPYTFSIVTDILFLPFIVAYVIKTIEQCRYQRLCTAINKFKIVRLIQRKISSDDAKAAIIYAFVVVVLLSGLRFYFITYQRYPLVSSDYWGWQYGSKEMITFFLDNQAQYDQFYMDNWFTAPEVFLDFYIRDPSLRNRAFIGGVDNVDRRKRQLFGIRAVAFAKIPNKADYMIQRVIRYPNGQAAYYLVELGKQQ
jgi:hypothetical protein